MEQCRGRKHRAFGVGNLAADALGINSEGTGWKLPRENLDKTSEGLPLEVPNVDTCPGTRETQLHSGMGYVTEHAMLSVTKLAGSFMKLAGRVTCM